MVGWHYPLDGHKFEQALGVGDGQGGLGCCSPCGHKELDMTEQLNWVWPQGFYSKELRSDPTSDRAVKALFSSVQKAM